MWKIEEELHRVSEGKWSYSNPRGAEVSDCGFLAVLPSQSCELAGVWCCKEAGSLGKLGVAYLTKYVCLGGLKKKTSGTELQSFIWKVPG